MMKFDNRGGARKGAGRKPLPPGQKKERFSTCLAPDVMMLIQQHHIKTGKRISKLIEESVRCYLGKPL